MILYIENLKDSTRKLLKLNNEYGKVAGYKINTQKSLEFLYTNNEKTEREIKETISFTITIQHSFGSFGHSNQRRKRNKMNPVWKRRSKILTVCR